MKTWISWSGSSSFFLLTSQICSTFLNGPVATSLHRCSCCVGSFFRFQVLKLHVVWKSMSSWEFQTPNVGLPSCKPLMFDVGDTKLEVSWRWLHPICFCRCQVTKEKLKMRSLNLQKKLLRTMLDWDLGAQCRLFRKHFISWDLTNPN